MLHIYILRAGGSNIPDMPRLALRTPVKPPDPAVLRLQTLVSREQKRIEDEHTMIAEIDNAERIDRHGPKLFSVMDYDGNIIGYAHVADACTLLGKTAFFYKLGREEDDDEAESDDDGSEAKG